MSELIPIIVICCVIIIVIIIKLITNYTNNGCNNLGPRIKFESFKLFYDINPDRWELRNNDAVYKPHNHRKIYFHFNIVDYYKYKHFCKVKESCAIHQKYNKEISVTIESVQKDIQECEQQNETEINDSIKDLWNL